MQLNRQQFGWSFGCIVLATANASLERQAEMGSGL